MPIENRQLIYYPSLPPATKFGQGNILRSVSRILSTWCGIPACIVGLQTHTHRGSPGPHPGGRLRGLARGVSRPIRGGGVSRPTPMGGVSHHALRQASPPPSRRLLLECILVDFSSGNVSCSCCCLNFPLEGRTSSVSNGIITSPETDSGTDLNSDSCPVQN